MVGVVSWRMGFMGVGVLLEVRVMSGSGCSIVCSGKGGSVVLKVVVSVVVAIERIMKDCATG